ncbi:MAG TPA: ABC transporter ATP-binding protein [Firmicutes bacterium]|nr:ABC transporter ATP-binding protein [Bacillota bacterium]
MSEQHLIEVKNLCKYFPAGKKRTLKAVDNVSLFIRPGETLGLVGESGCGKTTCGRTILKLYNQTSGQIFFEGKEISHLKGKELLQFKKNAQMIFQDPYSSLDPRMTIAEIIAEGMTVHMHLSDKEKQERVSELLATVGLTEDYANRFAHELSGGQRQRIGIARALAVEPKFIVCDEPISALDVSIQAQIVNLLIKLQHDKNLTYLFISHDLSMVRHISDRVGIMYLGSLVELGTSQQIFGQALHPYTKALISAIPEADPDSEKTRQRVKLEGEVPSPINPPPGCRFRPRCPYATEQCAQEMPALEEVEPGRFVACHFWRDIAKA